MADDADSTLAERTAEDLARLAQGGSSAAREALAERVRPVLAANLRRRCRRAEEAEDVCQEALLRAFRGLDGYDGRRPFVAWVIAIARNVAISRSRKRSPALLGAQAATAAAGPGPAEAAAQAEGRTAIWDTARRTLSARQYQVLWLHYGQGLGVREVSGRLGLTRTHVKVLLHRARKRLLACPQLREVV